MNASTQKTTLLLPDLQDEMVHPKGKIGGGGLAGIVVERWVIENAAHALAGVVTTLVVGRCRRALYSPDRSRHDSV